jgi:hypothetical protein
MAGTSSWQISVDKVVDRKKDMGGQISSGEVMSTKKTAKMVYKNVPMAARGTGNDNKT